MDTPKCPLFELFNVDECLGEYKNKPSQELMVGPLVWQTQWYYASIPIKEDDPNLLYRGPDMINLLNQPEKNLQIKHQSGSTLTEMAKNILAQPIASLPNQQRLIDEIKQKMIEGNIGYEPSLTTGSVASMPVSNTSSQKKMSLINIARRK
ncbi:hypothetical protein BMR1_02g00165 [Babesia microti strain RI]|uniref:Uncharacterized protein n=1 Tax=Babesia microti (strain RI) TaxID=1133968 RepID=I7J961_BABMR|nr:hypothetical protein BMR1_02g00165 [Babesia microti strain RI]CCF73199.1 hypothetical protein BMR1_02g00165 [Babesia microti strain RI]|eukprot:XP_012647808.1 hypothetical protein BMR1_02g00165 [Babesia microti strain RI]